MDVSHLASSVQPIALLSAAERIAYCDQPVWIKTTTNSSFNNSLESMIRLSSWGCCSCMALIGISGIGKTTMIERAQRLINTPDSTPIMTIDLAPYGRYLDLQQIFLTELGFTESVKSLCTASGIKQIKERIKQKNISVCILDEGNALAGTKYALVQPNNTYLRALANPDIGLSVVVAGTEELKAHLGIDPQLRSRFSVWEVPSWEAESVDFSRFLKAFVRFIPLQKPSVLDTKEIQVALVNACMGSTRNIRYVLIAAAKLAIESGQEFIDLDLLEVAFDMGLADFGLI